MSESDPAKPRFLVIAAVRLVAVLFIMLGILIAYEVIDLPPMVGWILLAIGMFEFFVIPTMLARMWSTPRE